MHRIMIAVILVAAVAVACGGEAEVKGPGEVKSCLNNAGFDTSEPTGLISLFVEGGEVEFRDEFMAVQDTDQFGLWFLKDEGQASAAADGIENFLSQSAEVPEDQPRVEGGVVFVWSPDTSPEAMALLEACLGSEG